MKIAIVGGAGFVGHHLALRMQAHGHDVTCIDNLMVNNLLTIQNDRHRVFLEERLSLLRMANVPLLHIDARDYDVMSRMLAHVNPDVIVHLAAVAHITVANKEPHTTFDNSLRTLENSLDIARALGCGLVYFSSSTVYGNFSQPVIREDEPTTPEGIYGNLKLAGERMAIAYNQTYGMPLCIIRPQALYGPRCVSGRVTQIFCERAFRSESITIHGNGAEEHDFTYIEDLLNGMQCVLELSDWHTPLFKTYNLTGESATSLGRLAQIITDRYPTKIEYGPSDPEKPSRGTMSCATIRGDLGYEPEYDIMKGMSEYMDWYDRIWRAPRRNTDPADLSDLQVGELA